MRIALGIEYDGTAYNGWQRQKTGRGVQELVERALSQVAAQSIEVVCSGRTDTGVHATGQVVHFDTESERAMRSWILGTNSNLPNDINVCWSKSVGEEFNARYSATARTYRYLILNRPIRSALFRHRAWWIHEELDECAMQSGANFMLGKHDFSAFRAAGCQASTPTRNIMAMNVSRIGEWLSITVRANAFLQHMVRNIAGALLATGRGERPPEWIKDVLDSRDRTVGGIAAPAHGLTLVRIDYPQSFDIPTAEVPALLPGVE
jgi:tRNA pseudouridine38-40 synthase